MKKVMLFAYFDLNIGDDLMVDHFLLENKDIMFYALRIGDNLEKNFSSYDNISFVTKDEFQQLKNDVDAYLYLGGSIYQINNFRSFLGFSKRLIRLLVAKSKGVKIISMGCNFGPYYNKTSQLLVKKILKLQDLIIVRDNASFDLIKDQENTYIKNDIVYESKTAKGASIKKKSSLGISVYNSMNNESNDKIISSFSHLINNILENDTIDFVKLFAFNSSKENDVLIANTIVDNINDKDKVSVIVYDGDIKNFINSFCSVDKIVAMRFHSAILSDINNIPFYPISYSNKMKDYLEDKTNVVPLLLENMTPDILINYYLDDSNLVPGLDKTIIGKPYSEILQDFLND